MTDFYVEKLLYGEDRPSECDTPEVQIIRKLNSREGNKRLLRVLVRPFTEIFKD